MDMFSLIEHWFSHFREEPRLRDGLASDEVPSVDDRVLLKRIEERLRWDQRVNLVDIHVRVRCGYVTLEGEVDAAFRRLAALELVSHTEGVWGYRDSIIVDEGYVRSDGSLSDIMRSQLSALALSPGEEIAVEVSGGVIRLHGRVHQVHTKALAAGLVWSLSGVRDCVNLIEVRGMEGGRR